MRVCAENKEQAAQGTEKSQLQAARLWVSCGSAQRRNRQQHGTLWTQAHGPSC